MSYRIGSSFRRKSITSSGGCEAEVLHNIIIYYIPMIGYSCSVLRYALVTHIVQVTANAVVTLYILYLQVTARRDTTYETCGVP